MLDIHSISLRLMLLAGATLAVLTAVAQSEPRPARPAAPPAPATQKLATPQRAGFLAGLEPEKRQRVLDVVQRARRESQPLATELRQARRDLQTVIWAEQTDTAKLRELAQKIGGLEGRLAALRARAASEIRPLLTPEQLARLQSAGDLFWEQGLEAGAAPRPARPAPGPGTGERPAPARQGGTVAPSPTQ